MTAPDRPFVALAVIAGAQGLALVTYAAFDAVEALRLGASGPSEVSNAPALVLLVVITAALGAGLLWIARGWWRARRWARAPFVLAQVLAGLIGYELSQSAGSVEHVVGIVAALVAVLGLALAFSPPVSRVLVLDQ